MLWLAAKEFGDDGIHFQKQVRKSIPALWGFDSQEKALREFSEAYLGWVDDVPEKAP